MNVQVFVVDIDGRHHTLIYDDPDVANEIVEPALDYLPWEYEAVYNVNPRRLRPLFGVSEERVKEVSER